jgi:hypothetical protein
MGDKTKGEYLAGITERYRKAGRKYKKLILDEFCGAWGYHRKHAIRLLRESPSQGKSKRGAQRKYDADVIHVVEEIWLATNRLCSKLLKAALPTWLPHYQKIHPVSSEVAEKVLSISPATIDRLLKTTRRVQGGRGLCGTRPGTWLKHQIPIKTDHSEVDKPGFLQADTVAHGGDSVEGDFVWTLTLTDVFSGWTENRAVWNKGYEGIRQALQEIEDELPFLVLGFHSDNGGEFLNHHLYRYLRERDRPIAFTRGRPSHKNDNPHAEQKNWHRVRQLLGYQRIEDASLIPTINLLYRSCSLFSHFFCPTLKLQKKSKIGSRYIRTYEKNPQTPYQRLMDSPHLFEPQKTHLAVLFSNLNPFALKKLIDHNQNAILNALR